MSDSEDSSSSIGDYEEDDEEGISNGGSEDEIEGDGEEEMESGEEDEEFDEEDDDSDDSDVSGGGDPAVPDEEKFDEDKEAPKTIKMDTDATCLSFHPSVNRMAIGTIDGDLLVYSYSLEENVEVKKMQAHGKSCRGLEYTEDGKHIYTISKDKSWKLFDAETLQVVREMKKAHESSLYSLAYIDEGLCATGDEDGQVRLWDHRTPKMEPVQSYKESEDYIADLLIEDERKKILLAASAEGTLSAFDVRKKKMVMQSELFEEEFLSLALIKNKRVVAGGSNGSFEIFNWNEFGYMVNAMCSLSKSSVDCLLSLDGTVVCYGCGDGNLRASSLFPNQPLGIIGKHCDFPVVSISLCKDKKYVCSASADQKVKFWNVEDLGKKAEKQKKLGKGQDLKPALNTKKNNFFAGLVDD